MGLEGMMILVGIVGLGLFFVFASAKEAQRRRERIDELVREHIHALGIKRAQLLKPNGYGGVEEKKWRKEVQYFLTEVVGKRVSIASVDREAFYRSVNDLLNAQGERRSSDYDPGFSGVEYEAFCAEKLREQGWEVEPTRRSHDQGVDLLARKAGVTVAIQCKHYTSSVGNKAVQEVAAGVQFYEADHAVVMSNAGYTSSAKELASKLTIALLHHGDIARFDVLYGKD